MEQAAKPKLARTLPRRGGDQRGSGSTRSKLSSREEQTKVTAPHAAPLLVTRLLVQICDPAACRGFPHVRLADPGRRHRLTAPLRRHSWAFGPQLRRFVLAQDNQGQGRCGDWWRCAVARHQSLPSAGSCAC